MFGRLIRSAPAIMTGVLVMCASEGTLFGEENDPAAAGPAVIELRKSFRPGRNAGRQGSRLEKQNDVGSGPGAPDGARGIPPQQLEAAAAALGEQLQSSGTLHLPGVGERGVVIQGSTTPILETAAGRRLIVDRNRTISPDVVDEINRRWPGFTVVHPPVGANLHEVIGSLLDAAGYDSVVRSAPLVFNRGISIRVTPDFVVLRSERDLLEGETRAISVVEPADALPSELRELVGEHRVRIVELTPDGVPTGVDRAPWSDPEGLVTTMGAPRLAPIIGEIAVACGLTVEHRVPLPAAAGEPDISADLRVNRDGKAVLVFENADLRSLEHLVSRGEAAIILNSAAELPEAIGSLLRRFGITALGPAVEFYPPQSPGSPPRFVISVPGWLAESTGRRLLITGTTLPPLVRLYLTREGIDIFEYRIL